MPLEIPPIVQPPATLNPLTQLGQYAELANSINANRLFQGRVEAGQLAQQAIDPATGQVDQAKFAQLIRNDPRAAPFAQEALTTSLSQQGQNISNLTAQQGLAAAKTQALRLVVGALPKGATGDDVANAVALAVKQGVADPATASAMLGTVPSDPAKVDAWRLANTTLPSLGPQGAFDQNYPAVSNINTGGQVQQVQQSRIGGGTSDVAPPIDTTLTPGEKIGRVPTIDKNTLQPETVPVGSLYDEHGNPKSVPGVTGPGGALPTAAPPGVAEAVSNTGQAYAQQAVALTQRAALAPNNKALLGNMEGLLGHFDPGPQSHWWKTLGQMAAEYHIPGFDGPAPKDGPAAQEQFNKFAFMLAQQQFQALGGTGTDSKLDSTMHTSPSEMLSRYGNQGIINVLKGNEDAIQAQSQAWQKYQQRYGATPDKYGQFLQSWTKQFDPRVFQSQYMDANERNTMLQGMNAQERKQFEQHYKFAYDQGWIQ